MNIINISDLTEEQQKKIEEIILSYRFYNIFHRVGEWLEGIAKALGEVGESIERALKENDNN